MLKGKIVHLVLLTSSDEDLKFYIKVGQEKENVTNLTDRFIGVAFENIRDSFIESYEDDDSSDFIFNIMWGKRKIGILYILCEVEKRTAEIQVLLSERKYRKLGLAFDAIYTAVKFAREELNLHSITFRFASHNEEMVKAFKYSQYGYEQIKKSSKENVEIDEIKGIPDIVFRKEFISRGRVSDYYTYTFIIDDDNFPYEDFLRLSSGIHEKYTNEEGKFQI